MPAHQATSLDFISRPNPVEPSATGHGHVAVAAHPLEKHIDPELLRAFLSSRAVQAAPKDGSTETFRPPAHRQITGHGPQVLAGSLAQVLNTNDQPINNVSSAAQRREPEPTHFTLPEPTPKRGVKRQRQRVPPVLQGLHQPPPNAGILPSINTEQASAQPRPVEQTPTRAEPLPPLAPDQEIPSQSASAKPVHTKPSTSKAKRNKWTQHEISDLHKGVARFGVGNWKKILLCEDYHFCDRTTVDLKDRYRVSITKKKRPPRLFESIDETVPEPTAHQPKDTPMDDASHPVRTRGDTARSKPTTSDAAADSSVGPIKSGRRSRRTFTEEEDQALIKGFKRYGASWSSIQLDQVLKSRTPHDLRDRFRVRYPDLYRKAGLAPKKSSSNAVKQKPSKTLTDKSFHRPAPATEPSSASKRDKTIEGDADVETLLAGPGLLDHTWLLAGLSLPDTNDADPIVLDRSIMDWANRTAPSSSLTRAHFDGGGIDPLVTLKLPKPGS